MLWFLDSDVTTSDIKNNKELESLPSRYNNIWSIFWQLSLYKFYIKFESKLFDIII